MFDWNEEEEELRETTWGEGNQNDDHIVPYPQGNKEKPPDAFGNQKNKQSSQEDTFGNQKKKQSSQEAPVKLAEQQKSEHVDHFSGSKFANGSQSDINERFPSAEFETESWPDSPIADPTYGSGFTGKDGQNSMGMQVSAFGTEMQKLGLARSDAAHLGDETGLFGIECGDKEHDGFLDYSWDNIGNFDDLDKIFRNDDPIFGQQNLDNADELWPSSADAFNSPRNSYPISLNSPNSGFDLSMSEQYEMKMESLQHGYQSPTTGNQTVDHPGSHVIKGIHLSKEKTAEKGCSDIMNAVTDCAGGKCKALTNEQVDSEMTEKPTALKYQSANKVKRKSETFQCLEKEQSDSKMSQSLCCTGFLTENQFQQNGMQFAASVIQTFPSSINSEKHSGEIDPVTYWQTSHSYMPAGCGSANQNYVMPRLLNAFSDRDTHQPVQSGYGFSPGSSTMKETSKNSAVSPRSLTMTPQEKLEKLICRQQLQAMFAIQKQLQQFGDEVPHSNHSSTEKFHQEIKSQDIEGVNTEVEESITVPTSIEPSSLTEEDYFDRMSLSMGDCSLEEKLFCQLEDVIGKLDVAMRLCLRDSLFRLALSATQRHNASDQSRTNKIMNENGVTASNSHCQNRLTKMYEAETETNQIDRVVASLLFHQPSTTRPTRDGELPEFPLSTKFIFEPNPEVSKDFPAGRLSDYSTEKQSLSHDPWLGTETEDVDQLPRNTRIITDQNSTVRIPPNMKLLDSDRLYICSKFSAEVYQNL